MIIPTATDLLRVIHATLKDKIQPTLTDGAAKSAMATAIHMVHFVEKRLELEGQALTDDIAAVRGALGQTRDYFATIGADGKKEAQDIDAALAKQLDSTKYPSLDILAVEAGRLREVMYQALKRLQELRPKYAKDAAYTAIRATVRSYVVRQVEQEGEMIAPAFFGRGPRR